MQKKIIALAVAGLVSGAAFAQSNVTLYGIVDMGYQYSWDNNLDHAKSKSEVKSGGLDGSRVGVKGVEDLGNGLSAKFDATWSFDSDWASAVKMGEGSSVSLAGKSWGEVRAGYFGSFLDDNTGVDASGRHGMINTGSLYGTGKYENFVAYYSPNFSGFQFKAGFSSNVGGPDVVPLDYLDGGKINTRAYTAMAAYENGPLKAGVAYASYQPQDISDNPDKTRSGYDWNAGIAYNFGVATVSLFGAQQKAGDGYLPNDNYLGQAVPSVLNADNYNKKTFWALGANAAVGANGTIKVGYGQAKISSVVDGNKDLTGTAWDIVYLHSLSKRTTAYAMYGNLGGDVDKLDDGTYQQAINFGIRHTF
ncbi:MAG: porin [Propionivibrio sp.]